MTVARHFSMEDWTLESAVEQFFKDGFKDGDLVSKEWIMFALDLSERDIRDDPFILLSRMEAFKTALLQDHQIALQNVKSRGYRVVPPAEQARYAAEEAAKYMKKGFRKAEALLTNTRLEGLSDDEKRRHTDTVVRMASLKSLSGKGRRDVFKLFKPQK